MKKAIKYLALNLLNLTLHIRILNPGIICNQFVIEELLSFVGSMSSIDSDS